MPSREHVMPTALAAAHVRMARAHGALGVAAPLPPADPGVRPAGPSRVFIYEVLHMKFYI